MINAGKHQLAWRNDIVITWTIGISEPEVQNLIRHFWDRNILDQSCYGKPVHYRWVSLKVAAHLGPRGQRPRISTRWLDGQKLSPRTPAEISWRIRWANKKILDQHFGPILNSLPNKAYGRIQTSRRSKHQEFTVDNTKMCRIESFESFWWDKNCWVLKGLSIFMSKLLAYQ